MFKRVSLELGGKNPTIIFADCDFDKTVAGVVRASFLNQGQVCLCGSRLLIQRPIYDKFLEALAAQVASLASGIGHPLDPATRYGSLISTAHRDKIESYVKLALEEGGTIVAGGIFSRTSHSHTHSLSSPIN